MSEFLSPAERGDFKVTVVPEISDDNKRRLSKSLDLLHSGALEGEVALEGDTSDEDATKIIEAKVVSQVPSEVDKYDGSSIETPADRERRIARTSEDLFRIITTYAEDPYTVTEMLQKEHGFDYGEFHTYLVDERAYSADAAPLTRGAAERLANEMVGDRLYNFEDEISGIETQEKFDELIAAGEEGTLYNGSSLIDTIKYFESYFEDKVDTNKSEGTQDSLAEKFKKLFGIDLASVYKIYQTEVAGNYDAFYKVVSVASDISSSITEEDHILPQIGSRLKLLACDDVVGEYRYGGSKMELVARTYLASLWIKALGNLKIKD